MNTIDKEQLKKVKLYGHLSNYIPSWHRINEDMLCLQFDKIDNLILTLEDNMNIKTLYESSRKEDSNWSGSKSLKETIEILKGKKVDQKTLDLRSNIVNKLKLKGVAGSYYIESYKFDTNEGELDIERMLQGEDKCYLNPNKKYSETFFDLIINTAITSEKSKKTFEINVANIIHAVYTAEVEDGLKIRLIFVAESKNTNSISGKRFSVSVIVKNYNEIANLDKILAMFHVSTFRRGIFRLRELVFGQFQDSSYGSSCVDKKIISMNTKKIFEPEEVRKEYMKQLTFGGKRDGVI